MLRFVRGSMVSEALDLNRRGYRCSYCIVCAVRADATEIIFGMAGRLCRGRQAIPRRPGFLYVRHRLHLSAVHGLGRCAPHDSPGMGVATSMVCIERSFDGPDDCFRLAPRQWHAAKSDVVGRQGRVVRFRGWPCDHHGVERRALGRAAVAAAHRLTGRAALLLDGELLLADHLGPFAGLGLDVIGELFR